jgi:hypothetical protein
MSPWSGAGPAAGAGRRRAVCGWRAAGQRDEWSPGALWAREDRAVETVTPLVFCFLIGTVSPACADVILINTAFKTPKQRARGNLCFGAERFCNRAGCSLRLGIKLNQKRKRVLSVVFRFCGPDIPPAGWIEVINHVAPRA